MGQDRLKAVVHLREPRRTARHPFRVAMVDSQPRVRSSASNLASAFGLVSISATSSKEALASLASASSCSMNSTRPSSCGMTTSYRASRCTLAIATAISRASNPDACGCSSHPPRSRRSPSMSKHNARVIGDVASRQGRLADARRPVEEQQSRHQCTLRSTATCWDMPGVVKQSCRMSCCMQGARQACTSLWANRSRSLPTALRLFKATPATRYPESTAIAARGFSNASHGVR